MRPTRAIWMEKSARLRNLLIVVISPEGLKFSAKFCRKILEFLRMPFLLFEIIFFEGAMY